MAPDLRRAGPVRPNDLTRRPWDACFAPGHAVPSRLPCACPDPCRASAEFEEGPRRLSFCVRASIGDPRVCKRLQIHADTSRVQRSDCERNECTASGLSPIDHETDGRVRAQRQCGEQTRIDSRPCRHHAVEGSSAGIGRQ